MARSLGVQLLDIIQEYTIEHGVDEVDLDAVSKWACETGRYQRGTISMEKQCKNEMANALRHTRHVDPQGREVRTKHAVNIKIKDEQMTLWIDIRTAKPNTMRMSFTQNRERIVKDVKRHSVDVDSYNDNNLYGVTIPPYDYNFNVDLEEAKMSGTYNDDDDEEENGNE